MSLAINPKEFNAWFVNEFTNPKIFENILLQNLRYFGKHNTELRKIDSSYNYRPDKLCYELYGQELWYPVILSLNNIGSVLQFKPDNFGNKIIVPSRQSLINLLDRINKTRNY